MNENGQESSLSDFEAARSSLRQRWELASVLNFFKVFEPVIESNLKISAEEIETSLIQPNKSLAQIHISLLKGIPPVSKNLKDPDAWVVALSKKLSMWWPWVAEGDFPLTAAKGAEMETYKKLDPTIRLVILKALCEIRADQHDVVSYINEGVKIKNEMSTFRKINIGDDGKGTSYWCDGDEVIGFRLYKEINTFKKTGTETTVGCIWETLATNLQEFQKVVDEYSSSKSKPEVAVSVVVETEIMPVLNKLEKKKQKALQRKRHEERILNNFCRVGTTRSCRRSKPVSYTFDEYDKVINEAIRQTKKMKTKEEQKNQKKVSSVKEDSHSEKDQDDDESTESDSENSKLENGNVSEDSSQDSGEESHENNEEEEEEENNDDEKEESDDEEEEEENNDDEEEKNGNDSSEDELVEKSEIENGNFVGKKRGRNDDDDDDMEEMRNFGAKKRMRQRPNRNSAIESSIVPDSEDESCSGNSDS
ncbi:unnamed protein product [Lactuca saligna]|uniref:DDT domain-containing protein n=1 Tax=Lactuca saligna TaxID=75948 RepID=A0AA35V6R4_LACSI|nr:unnamed protein product [Lactuca saligna]